MLRLWFPIPDKDKSTFLQRYTFHKNISRFEKDSVKLNDGYAWMSIQEIQTKKSLDPEFVEMISLLTKSSEQQVGSFSAKELSETDFIFNPRDNTNPQRKTQASLMIGATLSMDDQKLIYHVFFKNAFPYFFLNQHKFEKIMLKLNWPENQLNDLFRAFQLKSTNHIGYISYPEFVSGLAACEPTTPHGDICGEVRCRYIFRYYDKNRDNKLHFEEFMPMVKDIRAFRGASLDENDVQKEAEACAKVFDTSQAEVLSMSDFLTGVGQLKFRGTSVLLRSPTSIKVSFFKSQIFFSDLDHF